MTKEDLQKKQSFSELINKIWDVLDEIDLLILRETLKKYVQRLKAASVGISLFIVYILYRIIFGFHLESDKVKMGLIIVLVILSWMLYLTIRNTKVITRSLERELKLPEKFV